MYYFISYSLLVAQLSLYSNVLSSSVSSHIFIKNLKFIAYSLKEFPTNKGTEEGFGEKWELYEIVLLRHLGLCMESVYSTVVTYSVFWLWVLFGISLLWRGLWRKV